MTSFCSNITTSYATQLGCLVTLGQFNKNLQDIFLFVANIKKSSRKLDLDKLLVYRFKAWSLLIGLTKAGEFYLRSQYYLRRQLHL